MKTNKIPPYIRASSIELAQWQSAVASTTRKRIKSKNSDADFSTINKQILLDDMVLGSNLHVMSHQKQNPKLTIEDIKPYLPSTGSNGEINPVLHHYLSEYYFEAAKAMKAGEIEEVTLPPIEFPDSDYAYAEWAIAAGEWTLYANPEYSPYIDWSTTGNNIDTFGVITIPENSKIVVLGDFGTGLPDATMMLTSILYNQKPDFIIHLGDIYYSGTEDECTAFTTTFTDAFNASGVTVPVFSIPGNHEYYSGGAPFFSQVMTMNATNGFTQYEQMASYFCLRTASNNWQFLGMDTGYNSIHANTAAQLTNSYSPWLSFSEAAWHQNKLSNPAFTGKNILLSHHQLYSASAEINDGINVEYLNGTDIASLTYQNGNLMNVFEPYLDTISAWFWGHEHILSIFEDQQNGLAKGRLIGNSGYEEWEGQSPYTTNDSPYKYSSQDSPIEIGTEQVNWGGIDYTFYNHGFAVIQLNNTSAEVNYFECPVMNPSAAILPANQLAVPTQINFSDTL